MKDYIIVKTHEEAMTLIQIPEKDIADDIKGKIILILPNGLEKVTVEQIKKLPQIKEIVQSLVGEIIKYHSDSCTCKEDYTEKLKELLKRYE